MSARRKPVAEAERVGPEDWRKIDDWDEVVAASARPSVFLTRDWVQAWWSSFGSSLESWLLRVHDRERTTVALVPLYVEPLVGGVAGPVHRLGLIGDRGVGSEYLGMAARAGLERDAARAAVARLRAEGSRWDLADLSGLRDGDPAAAELELALGRGAARAVAEHHPCSAIALPVDFEAYLSELPPKLRQNYRRRTRNLARGFEVRFFLTESEAELQGHLETLFRLHQARWMDAGEWGTFADSRTRCFYLDISRRLLATGRLRFWHLEVDGAVRATQFGFVYDGVFHSLQEAFDTTLRSGATGLGVVLRGHVLRACIEEGLRSYDFLGGVEEHKTRWRTSVHHVRRARLSVPGARGRIAWLATVGKESAREAVKGVLPDGALARLRDIRGRYRRAVACARRRS
jgi:CelD/BcsL family acetyltransferase involved in cellulose biosynthesis